MRETEMTDNEAYVYEIKISKSDGIYRYIGWHYGLANGHYFNSSTNEQLKEDWYNHPDSREFIIVAQGTRYDMSYLEWKMLTEVDARNNPFYYNKSNGGGKYLKKYGDETMIKQIRDDVVERRFLGKSVELEELSKYHFYQVRTTLIDKSHGALLGQKISDMQGDMSDWEPLVILEDMEGPDGEPHTVGQGNHRYYGAKLASKQYKISPIPCQWIPKKVWSKLDKHDLHSLIMGLNPQNDKPSLSMSDDEAIGWILNQYKEKNVPINSSSNLEYLFEIQKFTKRKVEQGLMVKAKKQLDNQNQIPHGKIIRDYTSGDDKRNLEQLIEQEENLGYVTMAISSGMFKWGLLIEEIFDFQDLTKKYSIILYHTSVDTKNNWDKQYRDRIEGKLKEWATALGNEDMFTVRVLPWLKDNPLLQPNDLLEE